MRRAVVAALSLLISSSAFAQFDCSQQKYSSGLIGSDISISAGSGWSFMSPSSTINSGIGYWSGTCGGMGDEFPQMCTSCSSTGAYPVKVNFVNGAGPSCGVHTPTMSNGVPIASTITLYASFGGYSCQPYADSLAHELGHVLGLKDVTYSNSCYGSIMGGRAPGGTRTVTGDDCNEVDRVWTTPSESTPDPTDQPDAQNCQSPIILDLGHPGYVLTSVAGGVEFDLLNEGRTRQVAWTSPGVEDAFLAIDRNGNGLIDSGAELFGNFTPLQSGTPAPNGFVALAELDDNDDGIVDARDVAWPILLLWIDRNHDGKSAGELEPIAGSVVSAMETEYRPTRRKDRWGNEFRYKSHFQLSRDRRVQWRNYYDVFLVVEP